MSKGIILITKHFPFNNGETPAESYLENEINTLSANTDKVLILATEAISKASVTCSLPDNVSYIALQKKSSKSIKMNCTVKALSMLVSKKQLEITEEIKEKSLDIKNRLFLCYFAKRAMQKLERVDFLVKKGELDFSDYDIIYSFWFFDSAYMTLLAKEKYNLDNYKIVSRAHRYDLYEYSNKLGYIPLRAHLLKNLDGVFPCSENGTQYLSKIYPEYKSKIKTSFLGTVDYGVQPYKRDFGLLHIASCSRLIEVKRVKRIAECLAKLDNSKISVEWTHFGGGELFDELKDYTDKNLQNITVHLLGNTQNKEVMKKYSSMNVDVFVNVSENEGLPISIMEAASFGIPVIATDVGGTGEIVKDGENGFLLDKDFSDNELIEKLISIAEMSDDDYLSMRRSSRKIYEQNFECVHNVKKFLSQIGG